MKTSKQQFEFLDLHPRVEDVSTEVVRGLSAPFKSLSPKFFYDERGSKLFEAITVLAEYYPTRTELGLFDAHLAEIAAIIGDGSCVIEYGSGSSLKIRKLLDALAPQAYVPVDISRDYLLSGAKILSEDFPALDVFPVCADFSQDIELPEAVQNLNLIGFFPGSSIGNFLPQQAQQFLQRVAQTLGAGGHLLVGVDCKKDAQIVESAYNDSEGVTAAFNLNALAHLNRVLGANFELDAFFHEAHYDEALGCIQMFLRSAKAQRVTIGANYFDFAEGERLHTENSYKYTPEEFIGLAKASGFACPHFWRDPDQYFGLYLLQAI